MIKQRCIKCGATFTADHGHQCRNTVTVTPVTPRNNAVTVTPVTEPPRNTVTVTPETDRLAALEARVAKVEACVAGKLASPEGTPHPAQSRAEYMRAYRARKRDGD